MLLPQFLARTAQEIFVIPVANIRQSCKVRILTCGIIERRDRIYLCTEYVANISSGELSAYSLLRFESLTFDLTLWVLLYDSFHMFGGLFNK